MRERELKDVRLVLIHSANLRIKYKNKNKYINKLKGYFNYIDKNKYINKLKRYFNHIEWNEKHNYAMQFDKFQDRLFKDTINPEDVIKLKLGSFSFYIEYPNYENKSEYNKSKNYKVEVFAFIYPSYDIVNVFYSVPIQDISVDELIFVRKVIQYDKVEVKLSKARLLNNVLAERKYKVSNITNEIFKIFIMTSGYRKYKLRYIISKLKAFKFYFNNNIYLDDTVKNINTHKMMMNEIRYINDIEKYDINSEAFTSTYAQRLYGLLVCDEGYKFVPKQSALKALDKCFSSRTFFRVFCSNNGVLEINLVGSLANKDYNNSQQKIYMELGDSDAYDTTIETDYAGLKNGSLLALEKATMLHVIIDSNMKKDYFNSKKSVRKIISNRKNMIEIINIVTSISISEMATLTDIIMEKIGIYKYVERVRERLDIAEDDTIIVYQKWNNRLMLILTILGLFIALMSIDEIKTSIKGILEFLRNMAMS